VRRSRQLALAAGLVLIGSAVALAQTMPHQPAMPTAGQHAGVHGAAATPQMPGQDAFGAVQEIVRILEADPATDWSKVNMAALREHLIDMNELTLKAAADERQVDGGLAVAVSGSGRTLEAIKRMVTAHARELDKFPGWSAKTEPLLDGVRLVVTSADAKETARIRGLGFIGLMASGAHHQVHHLAMAKGEHIR